MSFRTVIFLAFALFNIASTEIYRLPKNIKPICYHLTMEPHLRDTDTPSHVITYNGSVVIELQALKNTRKIILHQVDLVINQTSLTVVDTNGNELKVRRTSNNKAKETYTVQLQNKLVKGENYTLNIRSFSGNLGKGEGFFKAFYSAGRKQRSLAATQFGLTTARRAFPCFDEPNLKASFIVSLIRKENYTSVSNENLDTTEDLGDGRFKDTFKKTPLMSTFILAFAVTDFKYSPKLERHRILARPEAIDNGEWKFSLDIANRTLKALEEYTGIDFVIDKMDQIAIPDRYFHQYYYAMENWGLVAYRESYLLRKKGSRAIDYKESTCYIAHEFAHQWFGNLVTPAWWDYLWLSESFASYFQYHIADIIKPSWRLKEQFVVDVVQVALTNEPTQGAHPLTANIRYSGQYPPFHIMYGKGSSIIRMMEHFLTHNVFRRGLQIYLKKNKFSNTVPSDLYTAFQRAVDKAGTGNLLNNLSVTEIMKSWEGNKGFPIITVTRDYKTGGLTLEQKARFEEDDTTTITKWTVPINYVFSASGKVDFANTTADYWLTESKATINNEFPTDGWLIVNKQSTGYYRVNYDLENWERIIKALRSEHFDSIDVLNRAELIDDSFNLASIGKLPWDIPLRLGEYIIREKDYIALNPFYYAMKTVTYIPPYSKNRNQNTFKIFSNYTLLNNISMKDLTEYDVRKQYIRTTLAGVNESLGFVEKRDDTHFDKIHRRKFGDMYSFFK